MADDLTQPGSSVDIGGVVFTDAANIGSGTGNYAPFLAIRDNDGNEAGFNTDTNTNVPSNPDIDASKTHSVLLATVPIIKINGIEYFEIRLDLNESNSDELVSLNQFKIYAGPNDLDSGPGVNLVDTLTELQSLNLVYNMDAVTDRTLLLNEVSTGSGTDDYSILVPVSLFSGYNLQTTYMFVYAELGTQASIYDAEAGFEEFNIQGAGTLSGIKFSDINSDGVRDADGADNIPGNADDEVGVGGVTIFIDADKDGVLDANERSTTTASDGSYSFTGVALGTWQIDEVVPAGSTQTTGPFETATISSVGQVVIVDPIGNHYPVPSVSITKTFVDVTDGPDSGSSTSVIDGAGDKANYSIAVTNDGETALTNVIVTDALADAGAVAVTKPGGFNQGDTDSDGVLDVGETWLYTATQTATQSDLDTNGGGDADKDNSATVVATQQGTSNTVTDTDTAAAPIDQNPAMTIEKTVVSVKNADGTTDADGAVDSTGDVITYSVVVTNTGNVTLENIEVTDTLGGSLGIIASLAPGASSSAFTYTYSPTQGVLDSNGGGDGDIDNTATATDDEAGTVTDSEDVPVDQNPAMTIEKTVVSVKNADGTTDADGAVDSTGDVITYSVVVTNTGNVTLENIEVTDTLGGNLGIIASLAPGASSSAFTYTYSPTQGVLDSNGGGDGDIDNTATATDDEAGTVTDSEDVPVDQNPAMTIEKTVVSVKNADGTTDADGAVDSTGDVITYSVVVTNTGNVTLENIEVTDTLGGNLGIIASLAPGASSSAFTYTYSPTQGVLDSNGGGDGDIDNTATATDDEAGTVTDSEDVPVDQNPAVDIEKYVSKTGGSDLANYIDADTAAAGYQNVGVQQDMFFAITAQNTGNVTLENVKITDASTAAIYGGAPKVLYENGSLTAFAQSLGASISGDRDGDGDLDVGETWTLLYSQPFEIGQHVNTASITNDQGATDSDAAYYYGIQPGPGVRTPGFWSNLGLQFWDGVQGNETKSGPTFAKGELRYAVDANNDGFINAKDGDGINDDKPLDGAGLLVGDMDKDGLTDVGEDTLFISYADALNLINASQKTMNGDGVQMLGRDVVATWLNYLAGNPIGDTSDSGSPAHYLQDAIDWLQTFGDKDIGNNVGGELFDAYSGSHKAVKTNSAFWNTAQGDLDHSAAQLHDALDTYNNTGSGYAMSSHDAFDVMLITASQATV